MTLEINCLALVTTSPHFRVIKKIYVSWKLYLFQSLINVMIEMRTQFRSSQFETSTLFHKDFTERFYRLKLLIITIWVFRNKDIHMKVFWTLILRILQNQNQ